MTLPHPGLRRAQGRQVMTKHAAERYALGAAGVVWLGRLLLAPPGRLELAPLRDGRVKIRRLEVAPGVGLRWDRFAARRQRGYSGFSVVLSCLAGCVAFRGCRFDLGLG